MEIWPLPRLHTLEIETASIDVPALVDVIRERYGGHTGGRGPVVPLARLLVTGHYTAPEPADVEALADLLGSDAVEWGPLSVLEEEETGSDSDDDEGQVEAGDDGSAIFGEENEDGSQ